MILGTLSRITFNTFNAFHSIKINVHLNLYILLSTFLSYIVGLTWFKG